jgi:hypothetical protein
MWSAESSLKTIQMLTETTEHVTLNTLRFLEQSSKSTLLFVAVVFGFLMAAVPSLVVMFSGPDAITTTQYLTTSLSGGALTLASLAGFFAADRRGRMAAAAVYEKSMESLEEKRRKADMAYGLSVGQLSITAEQERE